MFMYKWSGDLHKEGMWTRNLSEIRSNHIWIYQKWDISQYNFFGTKEIDVRDYQSFGAVYFLYFSFEETSASCSNFWSKIIFHNSRISVYPNSHMFSSVEKCLCRSVYIYIYIYIWVCVIYLTQTVLTWTIIDTWKHEFCG
jgi:hypothetical protein